MYHLSYGKHITCPSLMPASRPSHLEADGRDLPAVRHYAHGSSSHQHHHGVKLHSSSVKSVYHNPDCSQGHRHMNARTGSRHSLQCVPTQDQLCCAAGTKTPFIGPRVGGPRFKAGTSWPLPRTYIPRTFCPAILGSRVYSKWI